MLQQREAQVIEDQEYFRHHPLNHSAVWVAVIVVPALWLGWKMSGEKWVERTAAQLVEIVTLAGLTYFRRQIKNLFK